MTRESTGRTASRRGRSLEPFGLALACTLYCALRPHPVPLPIHEDLQHLAAFGALMVAGGWALPRRRHRRLLALALAVLGAAIEGLQALPVIHRDADLKDWLADVAGILLAYIGLALLLAIVARRQPLSPPAPLQKLTPRESRTPQRELVDTCN